MASAEHDSTNLTSLHAAVPLMSHYSNRATQDLAEEIDTLRKTMTETFLQEDSFTADRVMELSRQLDIKIIEYMKQVILNRE
ncbi:Spo0E family sporulation regulatory protein-aspartic acid phosphatase [Cohnella sp.]|uniref:Spo0E family sporulation regulatory protein-aspartic acid phosphatase n=1 Tax=Cohnella sp. TaxID=1883426 RepID=UPI003565054E